MARTVHKLKTVQPFYQSVQDGEKPFEIRFDDRGYKVGDYLHLCEWTGERFTGRNVWRRVSYILTWGQFPGLASGYVCMGFGESPDYETVRSLLQAERSAQETCVGCGGPITVIDGLRLCGVCSKSETPAEPVEGVVPGSELEQQIQAARTTIAGWPDDVKAAMGVTVETAPECRACHGTGVIKTGTVHGGIAETVACDCSTANRSAE